MTRIHILEAVNVIDSLQFALVLVGLHVHRYRQVKHLVWKAKWSLQHAFWLTSISTSGFIVRAFRSFGGNWITVSQIGSDVAAWALMMSMWLLALTLLRGHTSTTFNMNLGVPSCTYPLYQVFGGVIVLLFVTLETCKITQDSRQMDAVMLIVFSMLTLVCVVVSVTATLLYRQQELWNKLLKFHRASGVVCVMMTPVVIWRITYLLKTHDAGEKLLVADQTDAQHLGRLTLSLFLGIVLLTVFWYSAPTKKQLKDVSTTSGDLETGRRNKSNKRMVHVVRIPKNRNNNTQARMLGYLRTISYPPISTCAQKTTPQNLSNGSLPVLVPPIQETISVVETDRPNTAPTSRRKSSADSITQLLSEDDRRERSSETALKHPSNSLVLVQRTKRNQ